jgi:hypothetical protein
MHGAGIVRHEGPASREHARQQPKVRASDEVDRPDVRGQRRFYLTGRIAIGLGADENAHCSSLLRYARDELGNPPRGPSLRMATCGPRREADDRCGIRHAVARQQRSGPARRFGANGQPRQRLGHFNPEAARKLTIVRGLMKMPILWFRDSPRQQPAAEICPVAPSLGNPGPARNPGGPERVR